MGLFVLNTLITKKPKIMKNKIIIGLIALGFILPVASCKKGENDPLLSLRSRKGRISGEWVLESKESALIETVPNLGTFSSTSKYSNGIYSVFTTDFDGSTYNDNYAYSYNLNVEKSGSFESFEQSEDESQTINGYWAFLPRNKEAELKNKEALLFSINKELNISGSFSSSINFTNKGLNPSAVYVIDRLTNKEMVLKIEEIYNTSDGGSSSLKETLTFKAK